MKSSTKARRSFQKTRCKQSTHTLTRLSKQILDIPEKNRIYLSSEQTTAVKKQHVYKISNHLSKLRIFKNSNRSKVFQLTHK